jgi:hypothetical protein
VYAGKRHRSGAAVQILSDTDGQLRHVGEPIAGSIHDVRAFRETGLAAVLTEHMNNNLVIADLGYRGEPVLTPMRKPPERRTFTRPDRSKQVPLRNPFCRRTLYCPPQELEDPGHRISSTAAKIRPLPRRSRRTRILPTELDQF